MSNVERFVLFSILALNLCVFSYQYGRRAAMRPPIYSNMDPDLPIVNFNTNGAVYHFEYNGDLPDDCLWNRAMEPTRSKSNSSLRPPGKP